MKDLDEEMTLEEYDEFMKRWTPLITELTKLQRHAAEIGGHIESIRLNEFWRDSSNPMERFPKKLIGMKIVNY